MPVFWCNFRTWYVSFMSSVNLNMVSANDALVHGRDACFCILFSSWYQWPCHPNVSLLHLRVDVLDINTAMLFNIC